LSRCSTRGLSISNVLKTRAAVLLCPSEKALHQRPPFFLVRPFASHPLAMYVCVCSRVAWRAQCVQSLEKKKLSPLFRPAPPLCVPRGRGPHCAVGMRVGATHSPHTDNRQARACALTYTNRGLDAPEQAKKRGGRWCCCHACSKGRWEVAARVLSTRVVRAQPAG
jgi:hypothetical protein